jgi:hypothetical protein
MRRLNIRLKTNFMIKRNLIYWLIGLIISSCTTIQFETAQPKDTAELTEFPAEVIGKYISQDNDTLLIFNKSFQYNESSKSGKNMVDSLLKDMTVLKQMNDYYILSIKDTSTNAWEVFTFKKSGKSIDVNYIISNEKKDDDLLKEIKEITKVKEITDTAGKAPRYLLNPSKEEFQKLIDKKIFTKIFEFKGIKE